MNSLSCVLSYNYYDYKALLKEGKKKRLHESTLVRQSLYFCLFFLLLLSLTVSTLVRLDPTQGLVLVDQFGYRRVLGVDGTFCYKLLGLGWGSFILAWIINIAFYAIHPSRVDVLPSLLHKKMFINILGHKFDIKRRQFYKLGNKIKSFMNEFTLNFYDLTGNADIELKLIKTE